MIVYWVREVAFILGSLRVGLQRLLTPKYALRCAAIPYDVTFFKGFDLPELLRATAWRTSALKAAPSISSPSWMSIARRVCPSRLALKKRAGSFRDAPLAKVSFTLSL